MKRLSKLFLSLFMVAGLTACGSNDGASDKNIVIYSSLEEYGNEHMQKMLDEKFPDYSIQIQYLSTGNNAAKIKAEGEAIEADIIVGLNASFSNQVKDNFATLEGYDYSAYLEDVIPSDNKFVPFARESESIIVNKKLLEEKGLAVPTSYQDLLKPEYKGLISMPNPKSSSTGYAFLVNLVNEWGEDEAFEYFDGLSQNILQYTSSGSGPVNALVQGEVAIGLGMTFQAVTEINNGADLSILYFEEGSPWTYSTNAIINGRENKEGVMEVFNYLNGDVCKEDKAKFTPELIFKGQTIEIENYPADIPYGNMENDTVERKEALLAKWNY